MDFKCIFIVFFVLVIINQQEVDMEQYVIHLSESYDNMNNLQMFEFVVNTPQVVHKWFDSINFIVGSDQKLQVGRVIEIFIGKYSVYFTITDIHEGKYISMRSDSMFLLFSAISIDFKFESGNSTSTTVMSIQHYFNIKSKLFHDTIGIPLRNFIQENLRRALKNLKFMLCDLQNEGLILG